MTEIKVVVVNGKKKAIQVSDGRVLILCGDGPSDGAFWKRLEECTAADFEAAKEADVEVSDFDDENAKDDDTTAKYRDSFDEAVFLLAYMRGERFLELVRYAKAHGNSFAGGGYKQLEGVINGDDAYCSAIIKLTRRLGDTVERRAFMLFEQAEKGAAQDFLDFWGAIQVINSLL